MNTSPDLSTDQLALRASRMIWRPPLWPVNDRQVWLRGCSGMWPEGLDNPAVDWRPRTLLKNEDGYGRYLSWLGHQGILNEDEAISDRITPTRLTGYVASLKAHLSPVSVGTTVAALTSAIRALAPKQISHG